MLVWIITLDMEMEQLVKWREVLQTCGMSLDSMQGNAMREIEGSTTLIGASMSLG